MPRKPAHQALAQPGRSRAGAALRAVILAIGAALLALPLAHAQAPSLKIAVATSLSGDEEFVGRPLTDAAALAVAEANADGNARVEIIPYDDRSTLDGAREVARQVGAGEALVVIGPATSAAALAAGPIYAQDGVAAIVATAHADRMTDNATTFHAVFNAGEMGTAFATYLAHVLGAKPVTVVFKDDAYGRPIADEIRRAAGQLGIVATYHPFKTPAQREEAARAAAAEPGAPTIVLGMTSVDAVPALVALRHAAARGHIFGTTTIARASFAELFADQPEYRGNPGFFTDGVYALSPVILDSANAETLDFAARYRARFGREPAWEAVLAYDATRLAIAAVRAAAADTTARDVKARRAAARAYLASRDGPANAVAGLTGPLWFTPARGRQQATRVGRFHGTLFESAPLQLVPAPHPDPAEIAAGTVIDIGSGGFVRRQQVVYTGMWLNEIVRIDIARNSFTADFYLWMRFARSAATGSNPADIDFLDLIRGSSDGLQLAVERDLHDGTTYRLWRMRGDFKNDFDLHHYPDDRQSLAVRFFNAHAASDHIVYVQDRRTFDLETGAPPVAPRNADAKADTALAAEVAPALADSPADTFGGAVDPAAFRNLSQWEPLRVSELRDNLVTASALGDPDSVGLERGRELSGFVVTVELRRRVLATLVKTLLPLGLTALIMYASLYFPAALVKEKITVAVTAALSGAVLLSAINAQLGNVGYVIAIEYGFYIYFGLCLLCIIAVLVAERLRVTGRPATAFTAERTGRWLFVLGGAATIAAAWLAYVRW